ncbi:hypothetical protein JR316_0011120 [Psilocybe cubensis]|uniref:Uncharacterized protein n=2 Tax=Psilocybe cubensis TaxID=181762 RepID=A0ACB8GNF5_PSICU|nr:hypothetical protein JR316_0011120 [Psilocybe cubensis]KAH9477201.1 hypothetical protein JR316_0011120 [Psilocybe cubensis]
MQFTTKLSTLLVAIASAVIATHGSVIARNELAALSIIFFDDVGLTGSAYAPDGLLQSVCTTLPPDWLDRAESVDIATGFSCTFFQFQGCDGTGITLSGIVETLPDPELYDNIESFSCNKAI